MTETSITQLFGQLGTNDPKTRSRLFDLLVGDLRRLARSLMMGERIEHTLQATALVNEAYVRAEGFKKAVSRKQLFAIAARAMRNVLVDHARARGAKKRGGDVAHIPIDTVELPIDVAVDMLESTGGVQNLAKALDVLADESPALAETINLHYFCGLTHAEVAKQCDVCDDTVGRRIKQARARLHKLLK